ncbi:MAG TPA: hypothetical protein VK212_07260 [Lentimicrobium sp.]|nr:hypothetical protein [Lentimicrobium sp.]
MIPTLMPKTAKYIFLILIVFCTLPELKLYSQPDPSSKKHLERLIREGANDNFSGIYSILACNEDSLFFQQDTIRFYDDPGYFSSIGICCEFTEWEFIDDDLIRQQEPQTCLDPSSMLISSLRHFKYRLEKSRGKIYINLFSSNKEYESFLVKNIEYIELPGENNCRAITLIRQRPVIPLLKIKMPNPVKMVTIPKN